MKHTIKNREGRNIGEKRNKTQMQGIKKSKTK